MALLDKFKSKTKQSDKKVEQKSSPKPVKGKADLSEKKETIVKKNQSNASKKELAQAYNHIKEPYITEKAVGLGKKNKYVFEVSREANKPEIKKAINSLYGVEVEKVHIVKIAPKRRRLGRHEGWRKGLKKPRKKAIVTLKEGEKIELLPR